MPGIESHRCHSSYVGGAALTAWCRGWVAGQTALGRSVAARQQELIPEGNKLHPRHVTPSHDAWHRITSLALELCRRCSSDCLVSWLGGVPHGARSQLSGTPARVDS